MTVIAGVLYLLLVDVAVETFLSGSPVRWIVAGTVAACLVASVLLKRRLTPRASAWASLLVLLALAAATAWRPGGMVDGIAMLGQPTSRALTGITALAVAFAAWTVIRLTSLPVAVRAAAGLLAVYGLAALALGIAASTPYPALFRGQGLWTRLPHWLQGSLLGPIVLLPAGFLVLVSLAAAGMEGRRRTSDGLLAAASGLVLALAAAGLIAPAGASGIDWKALGAPAWLADWEKLGKNGPGLRHNARPLELPVPRAFDLSHVEPVHVAAALGKDPSKIFNFVRDEIADESYAGCLRGPRGALLAMAGNSVDRAALLGSLLQHAGYQVRYLRGSLPEALARQLVASTWIEHRLQATSSPGRETGAGAKAAGETLINALSRDGALLRDSLGKAGYPVTAGPPADRPDIEARAGQAAQVDPIESLVREAQDHYWLEWWHDGAWTSMDPSFAAATQGQVFAAAAATFDVLPESLFHRVEIRVRLEEYTGGISSSRVLLNYASNAADLSGVSLVLTHDLEEAAGEGASPSGGLIAPAGSPAGGDRKVRPFLVVADQQIAGSSFHLKAPASGSSAGFDGLLGGGGGMEPVPVATAESIELEFVSPGGRRERVVRGIFDLAGKSRRSKELKLSAEEVAARTQARIAGDFTDAVYDLFVGTGSIDAAHLANLTFPPTTGETPVRIAGALRTIALAFSAASDSVLGRIVDKQGGVCRFYLDSPRVLITEWSAVADARRVCLDLRRDRARAVTAGFGAGQLFNARVARGVVEGTLERIVIDQFVGPGAEPGATIAPPFGTSLLFELARASKTPVVVLARDSAALGAQAPEAGRAWIDEALAAGQIVVAPRDPVAVAGAPRLAWWEVDPRSGETAAVTDEGLRQATVEATGMRYKKGNYVAIKVDGRFLPNSHKFANSEQMWWFLRDLQSELASRGIDMTFKVLFAGA